jgi:hypothetical protein
MDVYLEEELDIFIYITAYQIQMVRKQKKEQRQAVSCMQTAD